MTPDYATRLRVFCKTHGFNPPTYEYRFHPERRWRFDAAWPERKVAIEIHGGVHRHGHHTRGTGFLDDREKMAEAQLLGWRVFECAPTGKHPQTLCSEAMKEWLLLVGV